MQLKHYQQQSLHYLKNYLEAARLYDNKQAYNQIQAERMEGLPFPPFQPLAGLEEVAYVCLRLPTGGGKTLLCAHSIELAGRIFWPHTFPLTLWMVPTTTIKNQTLETLKKPDHPNARVLAAAFGDHFRVFDIADFANIRPQDIDNCACIVVATFASLRVEDTQGRRAYDHHEELEGHFSRLLLHDPNLERHEHNGQVKYSFANLLHAHRPMVLIDEAHNAKSALSVEVLRRVNPRVVIEYTATPAKNSNVIQSVTAAQLKTEQMIKLPIIFARHENWQEAVTNSIQTRAKLEQVAHLEPDYVRPLVLFQAESKGGEVTVEVLRDFLITQENIPTEQIAIATGEQRELDNLNLFNPHCPIRYIITVQALKEGWDCSFAYVLCSLANTRSSTAIEQLLGRVLRMPYAKLRREPQLNQAYAHVAAKGWPHVQSQLTGHLVSMGFERQEAEHYLYQQPSLFSDEAQSAAPVHIILTKQPDLSCLDLDERTAVDVKQTDSGFELRIEPHAKPDLYDKIAQGITDLKDAREFQLHIQQIRRRRQENLSPAERGEVFMIPQLCLELDEELVLLEPEEYFGDEGFDPLASYTPLTRQEFSFDEQTTVYQADIQGEKIIINERYEDRQLSLAGIVTAMNETELAASLARNLYQDVKGLAMRDGAFLGYLHKSLQDLSQRGDMDLPKLVRGRFLLEKILAQRLKQAYQTECKAGLQRLLFDDLSTVKADLANLGFRFPANYPAGVFYDGRLQFKHHYYPHPAKMNKEEAECALILDKHPKIKYWVRNLERQMQHAFSLPTSRDWFYPDFVAKLDDERILVVEYKGEHLKGSDNTREKEMVGKAWARLSGNLFLMMGQRDAQGRDMAAQLRHILG